jgi:8-oxo-dGTP pyrophosphatase MutT (NUDIX family)
MSEEKEPEFGGVAIVYEDEIMLCLRSPNMEHYASHWSIPAGFVEYDETPQEAAIRELKEETMIEILDCEFVGVLRNAFYVYRYNSGTKLNPILDKEHTSWDYFKKDELPLVMDDELKFLIKNKIF